MTTIEKILFIIMVMALVWVIAFAMLGGAEDSINAKDLQDRKDLDDDYYGQ